METVLARLAFDMTELVGKVAAGRVDPLTSLREEGGDWVLRQPVDRKIGLEAHKLAGNRDVSASVTEPDG